MKLDDNSRAALHYLLIGLLVLAIPSLAIWLIDLSQTMLVVGGSELLVFRNGYLLSDPQEMALAGTSRAERIALSFLIAALVAVLTAIAGWSIGGTMGRRPLPSRLAVILGVAVLCGLVFAALRIPPTTSRFEDGVLVVEDHPVIIGDLTLPWVDRTRYVHVDGQSQILSRSTGEGPVIFLLEKEGELVPFASARLDSAGTAIIVESMQRFIHKP